MSNEGGRVFSDSLELLNSLAQGVPTVPDWRASKEIWDAWRIKREYPMFCKIAYRSRQDSLIELAHSLANKGRLCGRHMQGVNYPYFQE